MNKYLAFKKLDEVQSVADESMNISTSEIPNEWEEAFIHWQDLYAPNYDISAEDAFIAGIRAGMNMARSGNYGF